MWYVIWRSQKGKVMGFILDDNEDPLEFETKKEAENAMEDHILKSYSEVIEL